MAPQQQPPPPGDTDNVDEDQAADDADDLSDLQQPEEKYRPTPVNGTAIIAYRVRPTRQGDKTKNRGRTYREPAVLMDTTTPPFLRLVGNKSPSDSPLPLE